MAEMSISEPTGTSHDTPNLWPLRLTRVWPDPLPAPRQ
jgi:hypothetical protein